MSRLPRIKHVRAFVVKNDGTGGGADYHDQGDGHWIDDHIATPMSRYPEYRQSRQSFGINVLGIMDKPATPAKLIELLRGRDKHAATGASARPVAIDFESGLLREALQHLLLPKWLRLRCPMLRVFR